MTASTFPQQLRRWRQHRRCSQLDLALSASVSQRHLSCLESGKALPSRQMVLLLAEAMNLPLRDRNALLLAAGYAPRYAEPALDTGQLVAVRTALDCLLAQHAPFPALIVDRDWHLLQHNDGVSRLLQAAGITPERLANLADVSGRLNVMRLTLHPDGLQPLIENLDDVQRHFAQRCRREQEATLSDAGWLAIQDLLPEMAGNESETADPLLPVMPLTLRAGHARLSLFATLTTLGTPMDVTTDELRVECLHPLDEATRAWFRREPEQA